ncbi:sialidase family protein [Glaesserella parasuis]|uniref:sialidase family protein n=1 Tax=Glaesserella parasuis TaxID=738 RepID=UPI00130FF674|nr:exo-alpha-sialidase [Glaesserella parasuis]MWP91309.1 sialidase [Glaesserella parasuis]MWQ51061.1 sialidase [Glaesserella parasuis]
MKRRLSKNVKCSFVPSLIFLALASNLHATTFWKSDLNENLTHITKRVGQDNFTVAEEGRLWPGIGPNGEAPGTVPLYYSRIPAMTITDDNKMVVMYDLRWNSASDQDRIDPGVSISEDGGNTWLSKTAWTFNDSKMPLRRAMDPTILYNSIDGSIYVMHGTWATGNRNWYQDRFNYFQNNIWATTIYKSIDGGKTWEKNAEFSKLSNPDVFSKVSKGPNNPVVSFLGGVGFGIVMRNGTLVFPIQTAHNYGIAATIMYSKDNGKTWEMPETTDLPAPNQISLENMVFEMGNKLIMVGREERVRGTQADKRWAYYTEDMGKSWHAYEPASFGSSTAQPSQGSSIYVTLPNGRRVLLVSKPNGNNDNWARGNLALWMLDAKDPSHVYEVAIIRPGSGNAAGAGYSSLAYKEGNLFVAYEDDGNITVKNLTQYMTDIQAKALEWNLPDEIEPDVEKINALMHLNQGQKDELIAKLRRANDNAIAQSNALDQAMSELKLKSFALSQQAVSFEKALPSNLKNFQDALASINTISESKNTTNVNYLGVHDLYDSLYTMFLALKNPLDFTKYIEQAKHLNEYNHDILYRSFDDVFAHYSGGSKYNKLSLGGNKTVSEKVQAGLFFEYSNKHQKSYHVGMRAKYQLDNHQIAGFIRYRGVKHQDFIERNNNVDLYLNYAYQLRLSEDLSVSPSFGAYISRSNRTLLDQDVAVNKRTVYAGDVGVNLMYKINDINVNIRPNIAFINDSLKLSQSNDKSNVYKISSHNTIYGLATSINKAFSNGLKVGSTLELQKYGSQYSNVNLGVDISYTW